MYSVPISVPQHNDNSMCYHTFSTHYVLFFKTLFSVCVHRTVSAAASAGFQLRRDGVGQRGVVPGPLPGVAGGCQPPAGHRYRAASAAPRGGRAQERGRAEERGRRSGEAVPLGAQVIVSSSPLCRRWRAPESHSRRGVGSTTGHGRVILMSQL